MAELDQRPEDFDELAVERDESPFDSHEQRVGYEHARQNRLGRTDPLLGLARTHNFGVEDANIADATLAGAKDHPVTFGFSFLTQGAAPNGLLFELSDADQGVAAAIVGSDLQVVTGHNSLGGADVTYAIPGLTDDLDMERHIVIAILPGGDPARLQIWVDGEDVLRETTAGGYDGAVWYGGTQNGSAGSAPQGDADNRIPVGARVAPVQFVVSRPLQMYRGQLPRQFGISA